MEHKKYKRIDGVWQEKTLNYYRDQGLGAKDIKWCITEKVHGSNFAYYITADDLKHAKRSAFIANGENFYQYYKMDSKIGWKMTSIWNHLEKLGKKPEIVIIYGELCGGNYPHPDVENDHSTRMIQKGVWYSPNIEFYIFDIVLNGEFLPMDEVIEICEIMGLLCAEIIFAGTFEECLFFTNEFQTRIPEWLDYPPIEGDMCEGWVMKPIEPLFLDDGERVILKSKNERYMEVSKEPRMIKMRKELSEFAQETLHLISYYINENRLDSVLSKFGEFCKTDFKNILGAFLKDVYESFNMNHDNFYDMAPAEKKRVQSLITKECVYIWRPIFLRGI